ncbi:hypothetical protein BHM03_00036526 [Ensete ventricosum]|nr:hypothetical protein BHM03_00036526 [Ensete ventricosum]
MRSTSQRGSEVLILFGSFVVSFYSAYCLLPCHCCWSLSSLVSTLPTFLASLPFSFPPIISRAGRMSSASSHSESHSVEMPTRRSRALSHPSGDSRLTALVFMFGGVASVNSGTADALVAMQSNFDVDSTVMTRRLVEVRKNYFIPSEYELHAPLPGSVPMTPFRMASVSPQSLRKRSQKQTFEPLTNASGSTIKVLSRKGKEPMAIEEALEWGYILWELCEVEDHVGAEKYFATVMTWLKVTKGEDPLMQRWSAIAGSSQFWTEGPLSGEYLRGALHPALAKQVYECSSEELMNRASKLAIWLVRSKHERILTLRATNKELKGRADQDLVAVAESHAKELEGNVNRLQGKLESLKTQRRGLRKRSGSYAPASMGLGTTKPV